MLSGFLSPRFVQLDAIPSLSEGDYVSFVGYVDKLTISGQYAYLTLCDSVHSSTCISVMASESNIPLGILDGDYVSVNGTVKEGNAGKYVSVYSPNDIAIRQ